MQGVRNLFLSKKVPDTLHFPQRELAARMRQALAQLPPEECELLLLRYLDYLSNQEIAHWLEISPGTASKRHGRALLRLHKVLHGLGLGESDL